MKNVQNLIISANTLIIIFSRKYLKNCYYVYQSLRLLSRFYINLFFIIKELIRGLRLNNKTTHNNLIIKHII